MARRPKRTHVLIDWNSVLRALCDLTVSEGVGVALRALKSRSSTDSPKRGAGTPLGRSKQPRSLKPDDCDNYLDEHRIAKIDNLAAKRQRNWGMSE